MIEQTPWRVTFHRNAQKDAVVLARNGLRVRAESIIAILRRDPFTSPPPFERLRGDFAGAYSRRLNIQHRVVYVVLEEAHEVRILRMWSHYE